MGHIVENIQSMDKSRCAEGRSKAELRSVFQVCVLGAFDWLSALLEAWISHKAT